MESLSICGGKTTIRRIFMLAMELMDLWVKAQNGGELKKIKPLE